jgi:hypothetical protein
MLGDLMPSGTIPEALRGVLLDRLWDKAKLWALDLPVEVVPISSLDWQLDLPWWQFDGDWFIVSPSQVRANPSRYREQWERAMRADLSAPIHTRNSEGRLVILDGVHRLLKAAVLGRRALPVRTVPTDLLPQIYVDEPSF